MASISELTAADIMTKAVVAVRPGQALNEAELVMIEHRIGGVPVVENKQLVGILSRSDIARVQVLSQALDGQVTDESEEHADGFEHSHHADFQGFEQRVANLKVKDAMRHQVVTCQTSTLISKIAADMVGRHIHRVVVVDGERPVGIISSLDIVKLVAAKKT